MPKGPLYRSESRLATQESRGESQRALAVLWGRETRCRPQRTARALWAYIAGWDARAFRPIKRNQLRLPLRGKELSDNKALPFGDAIYAQRALAVSVSLRPQRQRGPFGPFGVTKKRLASPKGSARKTRQLWAKGFFVPRCKGPPGRSAPLRAAPRPFGPLYIRLFLFQHLKVQYALCA